VAGRGEQVDQLETLRAELEEKERIIAELQQGERVSNIQGELADRVSGYTVMYLLIG
jgi:hypothetical protein